MKTSIIIVAALLAALSILSAFGIYSILKNTFANSVVSDEFAGFKGPAGENVRFSVRKETRAAAGSWYYPVVTINGETYSFYLAKTDYFFPPPPLSEVYEDFSKKDRLTAQEVIIINESKASANAFRVLQYVFAEMRNREEFSRGAWKQKEGLLASGVSGYSDGGARKISLAGLYFIQEKAEPPVAFTSPGSRFKLEANAKSLWLVNPDYIDKGSARLDFVFNEQFQNIPVGGLKKDTLEYIHETDSGIPAWREEWRGYLRRQKEAMKGLEPVEKYDVRIAAIDRETVPMQQEFDRLLNKAGYLDSFRTGAGVTIKDYYAQERARLRALLDGYKKHKKP